jgi:hypothetical protein
LIPDLLLMGCCVFFLAVTLVCSSVIQGHLLCFASPALPTSSSSQTTASSWNLDRLFVGPCAAPAESSTSPAPSPAPATAPAPVPAPAPDRSSNLRTVEQSNSRTARPTDRPRLC